MYKQPSMRPATVAIPIFFALVNNFAINTKNYPFPRNRRAAVAQNVKIWVTIRIFYKLQKSEIPLLVHLIVKHGPG